MRILLPLSLCLGFAIGCGGGGGSTDAFVDELTTNSQVDLCDDFVTNLCANSTDPDVDGFCADACVNDAQTCIDASEGLNIDAECEGVLVSDVEDCFDTGDLDICEAGGGGCIFDAIDAICAPV